MLTDNRPLLLVRRLQFFGLISATPSNSDKDI